MFKQNTFFRERPLFDAFEQQSAQNWLPLEITQLSAGAYQGQLREIQHNDVSVCFEQQNCMVHKRGIMVDPYCTVSFTRRTNAKARISEYDSQNDFLFFIPSGYELDVQVGKDVETVYFRFNQAQFLERARVISPLNWSEDPNELLIFNSSLRKQLEVFSQYIYSQQSFQFGLKIVEKNQILGSLIMDKVILALDTPFINNDRYSHLITFRRAKERVSQALEYIDHVLINGVCPSIVDICIGINVSQRNLQYSFKKVLGLTPNAYLYYLRLNRARVQLSTVNKNAVTVTQVAMNWQFWHLGRFAHDYLQLFGELPSTTLLRSMS